MPTQLEQVQVLILDHFRTARAFNSLADQGSAFRKLNDILDATQNPGPQNDGSIDRETWTALMEALRGIRDISGAFRRVEECFDTVLSAKLPNRTPRTVRTIKRTKLKIPRKPR